MKRNYFTKINTQITIQMHTDTIRRYRPRAGKRRLKAGFPLEEGCFI